MRYRRHTHLVAAALFVAALCATTLGCKSPDGDEGAATTAPTSQEFTTRDTGVSTDTIKVGIPYLDLSSLENVINISHGDYRKAYTAVIDDLNVKGINGRTIEPVFAPVPPAQLDPDAARNACTQLTEDDEVFAAVGFFDGDSVLCYVEAHDTPVVGGYMSSERRARATAPWFAIDADQDERVREGISALGSDLDDGAKVAVVATPADASTLDTVAKPALTDAGYDVVDTAVLDASGGDVQAATTQAATIAERFATNDVDAVVTLGSSDVVMIQGLARTSFRPTLVTFNTNGVNGIIADGTADESILADTIAFTEVPPNPTDDPVLAGCIDKVEPVTGQSVENPDTKTLDGKDYWVAVRIACQTMGLFAAIAEKAGPDLNNATFANAGFALGDLHLPGLPGAVYSEARPDGALPLYLARFDTTARRMIADAEPVAR